MNEIQILVRNKCNTILKELRKRLVSGNVQETPGSLPLSVLQSIHDEIVSMRDILDPATYEPAYPKDLIANWKDYDLYGELLSVASEYHQLFAFSKTRNLQDLLKSLKKRPLMYLGRLSLKALSSYINGYEAALRIHNIYEEYFFDSCHFSHFLVFEHKFDSSCISGGWDWYLSKSSADEWDAFDKFFRFYDEYLSLMPKVAYKLSEEVIKMHSDEALKYNSNLTYRPLPTNIEIIRLYPKKWCFLKYYFSESVEIDRELFKNNKFAIEKVKSSLGINQDMWLPINVRQNGHKDRISKIPNLKKQK